MAAVELEPPAAAVAGAAPVVEAVGSAAVGAAVGAGVAAVGAAAFPVPATGLAVAMAGCAAALVNDGAPKSAQDRQNKTNTIHDFMENLQKGTRTKELELERVTIYLPFLFNPLTFHIPNSHNIQNLILP